MTPGGGGGAAVGFGEGGGGGDGQGDRGVNCEDDDELDGDVVEGAADSAGDGGGVNGAVAPGTAACFRSS